MGTQSCERTTTTSNHKQEEIIRNGFLAQKKCRVFFSREVLTEVGW